MPGVYTILNLVTGRCYVGSSICVEKRWREHLWALRHGVHINAAFQADWSKYGSAAFSWTLAEECASRGEAIHAEQRHIDSHPDLYNATRYAHGGVAIGYKQRPEVGEKIRIANTGKKHTAETKAKMSARYKGRDISSWVHKMAATKTGKPWSAKRRAAWLAAKADTPSYAAFRAKLSAAMKGTHAPTWSDAKRKSYMDRVSSVKCVESEVYSGE